MEITGDAFSSFLDLYSFVTGLMKDLRLELASHKDSTLISYNAEDLEVATRASLQVTS